MSDAGVTVCGVMSSRYRNSVRMSCVSLVFSNYTELLMYMSVLYCHHGTHTCAHTPHTHTHTHAHAHAHTHVRTHPPTHTHTQSKVWLHLLHSGIQPLCKYCTLWSRDILLLHSRAPLTISSSPQVLLSQSHCLLVILARCVGRGDNWGLVPCTAHTFKAYC